MEHLEFLDILFEETYDDIDLPVHLILKENDYEKIYSNFSFKIMPNIFERVQFALREDLLVVPIFKILFVDTGKSITVTCKRNNFDTALTNCIEYFEETQEYEKCQNALKMLELN